MKKLIFISLILFLPIIESLAAFNCSGACPPGSGCLTWSISYEVDCAGTIETYEALYYEGGYSFSYIDNYSNPEFIGMAPGSLSDDCETSTCI